MSFVASSSSMIKGDAINYVCGNQITQIIKEEQKECTIYNEFRLGGISSVGGETFPG
ncbi:hypothetical protein L218DRAFT_261421 [Marasmius fiardii PR-910]|nr:hypothetical protein L218DRAFT_261421 [Marasmius fiardii PR-910]